MPKRSTSQQATAEQNTSEQAISRQAGAGQAEPGGGARIRMTAAAPVHAGMRLDQVAAELFGDFSRARLQKWIRSGELTVNGRASKPTQRLSGGENLALDAVPEYSETVLAQEIPLALLHADADLIVLDKPAGLVVHPAAGNPDGTLQNALLNFDPHLAALPRASCTGWTRTPAG
jgi:23S rRNA pseudouridine1911/1915/1917 synthase